jgi:hypothetical protein
MTGSKSKNYKSKHSRSKNPRSKNPRSKNPRSKNSRSKNPRSKNSRTKGSRSKGSTRGKKGVTESTQIDIIPGAIAELLKVASKNEMDVLLNLNSKLIDKNTPATDCSVITNVENYFKQGKGKEIAEDIITSNPAIKGWLKTGMEKHSNLSKIVSQLNKCSTGSGSPVIMEGWDTMVQGGGQWGGAQPHEMAPGMVEINMFRALLIALMFGVGGNMLADWLGSNNRPWPQRFQGPIN